MEKNNYLKKIENLILSKRPTVTQVKNLDFILVTDFTEERCIDIKNSIFKGNIASLKTIPIDNSNNEDLVVMKFADQYDIEYIVLLYDNDQLWQNPEIIDLIVNSTQFSTRGD